MFQSTKNTIAAAVTVLIATAGAAHAAPAAASTDDTARVIVGFKAGGKQNGKAAIAAAKGNVKVDMDDINASVAEVPAKAVNDLRNNPHIEFVENDGKRYLTALATPSTGTPYKTGQQVPYGIAMVQADQLPDTYAGNRTVCIIDSGIDLAHEDLSGNHVTGQTNPGTGAWNTDENHHGTHVAGTIAALNNAGKGVVGVNANGKLNLHIIKVFGADGWAYTSTLIAAANKCGAAGANVISMSLGGDERSQAEERAFDGLAKRGVLSIAAAGNDGNNTQSYPAGYPSVMSVAALDENKVVANFSQFTDKVEIAGPGVGVLSTVPMGSGRESALKVGATTYAPGGMDGSPAASVTAPLADFGLGDATNAAVAGKVCLIKRGSIAFSVKVANCQASGGVGAVVYNNAPEGFAGTLGGAASSIPSVTASGTEGATLQAQLGQSATVNVTATNYAYFNGTSMATPHVSAVAALVWSYFPNCSAAQIRSTLGKTALDLGAPGRDAYYGYGLVQAKAAYDRIRANGCNN
ncbi:S8 family serine peptidase [Duganella sp. FT92W]|uniref:S8 family serine peptidase n=1 Tax=Pseudoduganella rivuli TaxID=2666085 RepID=A0A7X2IMK5_9BURK|nr:S8 family serine peptidase [Pseudoduganella rivuli]MRV72792.1 S8 family serine peptidase [Pseudoduganella rivuli]